MSNYESVFDNDSVRVKLADTEDGIALSLDLMEGGESTAGTTIYIGPEQIDGMCAWLEKYRSARPEVVAQRRSEMGTTLNRDAYEKLIDEDITALLRFMPYCLERTHIEQVLRRSPDHEYVRPEERKRAFLLDGARFKLTFNNAGKTVVFWNYAKELEGRWVALVPAEDDRHLCAPSPPRTTEQE